MAEFEEKIVSWLHHPATQDKWIYHTKILFKYLAEYEERLAVDYMIDEDRTNE
jgi:hypothetical protein